MMTATKQLDTPIFQLTVGEFLAILKQEQKAPLITSPEIPEIFGTKKFKEISGYSYASIYAKTSKNELPHFKRDGKLFFRLDEIMDWLTANRISTIKDHCRAMDDNLVSRKKNRKP